MNFEDHHGNVSEWEDYDHKRLMDQLNDPRTKKATVRKMTPEERRARNKEIRAMRKRERLARKKGRSK